MPTPAEPDFVFGRDHLSIWVNEFHLADDTVGSLIADFDLHHVDALSFSSPWLGKSTQDMLSVIGAPQHHQRRIAGGVENLTADRRRSGEPVVLRSEDPQSDFQTQETHQERQRDGECPEDHPFSWGQPLLGPGGGHGLFR